MVEHADLFRKYFMSQPAALGSAKFAALHQAFVASGTFLYVPRGVEIDLPIEIFHWLHGENAAVFPHLLLVADELAKVTVIESFRSVDRQVPGFACGVNDLIAGPGAKVTYVCAQNWGRNVVALQINSTTVDHDASAISLNLHLGGKYSRFESPSQTELRNSTRARCRTTSRRTPPAISFTKTRSTTTPAALSAASSALSRTRISPTPIKKCAIFS
jgi:Fe-S cluster assembly protein SufD